MSTLSTVILKDGTCVERQLVETTQKNLLEVCKKNQIALWELSWKCERASYCFIKSPFFDSKPILKQYQLINHKGNIPSKTKKIISNSLQIGKHGVRVISPLRSEISQISVVTNRSQKTVCRAKAKL